MRGRDLVIVGAIVVVAGFAAADTLRNDGQPAIKPTTNASDTPEVGSGVIGPPRGFEPIPLGGAIVFEGDAPRAFFDGDAAWSPDGEWIAVAEPQTIAFHRVVGEREVVRWPAAAARLFWRR